MPVDGMKYIKYVQNNDTLFYDKNSLQTKKNFFTTYKYNKNEWHVSYDENWYYMLYKEEELPDQGWKIHVSANIDDAQEVLSEVSKLLIKKKISFKFVPTPDDLLLTYSKGKDRIEAGKFITIYPGNIAEFCNLLEMLRTITCKYKEGPYILNDRPWKQSNVYYRYGAYTKKIKLKDGIPTYVIKAPNGDYLEDKREPYYTEPYFVKEPTFVQENNTFPEEKEFAGIEELGIKDAIHFSLSGGIYNGKYNNQDVVIKEGRPNIGLGDDRRDGFTRILDEYNTLKKLEDVDGVVNPIDYKKIWKHDYLIEEKIDAITLGEYLSVRFPFANQFTDKIGKYKKDTVSIIDSLVQIIKDIHKKDVAFVDFQPENIMVSTTDDDVKVKLIDFESSKKVSEKYNPDLVIPEYSSFQSKTYGDADWFALFRIARTLFLPVEPTMIYSKQLEERQNENIKAKFGQDIVDYLIEIRNICERHTKIFLNPSFYKGNIGIPRTSISRKNISTNIDGLLTGLVTNVDYNFDGLIHGDVNQFDEELSKYSINNGAMGAVMAISRTDSSRLDSERFQQWLQKAIENIFEIVENVPEFKVGLFDGLCGIALALYDLDKKDIAENLMQYCNANRKEMDISIYSGLSGIGLANLSLYSETKEQVYKENSLEIINEIITRYDNGEFESKKDYEGKFSLIKGWSGAVLLIWKASILFNNMQFKAKSIEILDKLVDKGIVDSDRGISLLDKNKKIQRLLPYLDTGFAGISILLIDMLIDDNKLIHGKYNKILNSIKYDAGSFCSYCCSLFSGVSGLIVSANATYQYFGQDSYLDNYINSLNNYVLSKAGNDILVPGIMEMKCSMDYETGAAGILLALIDYYRDNDSWYSWFPLLKNNKLNLFNKIPSRKIE